MIGVLTLLFHIIVVDAQNNKKVEIYFDQGSSNIDRTYSMNDELLDRFKRDMSNLVADTTVTINRIKIDGYASPEGGVELNNRLALRRAEVLRSYIDSLALNTPDSLIEVSGGGIAWGELRSSVSASDMPYKREVLRIIDEIPEQRWDGAANSQWLELMDSRNKLLMDLEGGVPYKYMLDHIFPLLRKGSVVTIYFKSNIEPVINSTSEAELPQSSIDIESGVEPLISEQESTQRPLFALKTNLLYDAITVLNIEVEIPIGQRWSVAGEWIFPWWTSCRDNTEVNSRRNTLQLLQGNIEGRYWFGDRSNRGVMRGWFGGLYGGVGMYDLGRKAEGYQGDFYVVGLSGGYAHTINKRGDLRVEYSLGVGYMQSDYNYYREHFGVDNQWHTIRQESGRYGWFGPTKAKVSLVWMLNKERK